ncbi:MAG: MFS transporter [Chloroflexi bacterium]|nr:MFS transporter [Chloroflexota bacterium]
MPRIPLFVVTIALANFLVPLNSTMIVVALPTIARDLAVDRVTVSWLVTAYLIAMAALQPIGGRIGDRVGRRRVLLGALVGFTLASGAAPLARDFPTLVAFRLLQAVCAAAVTPNAMGLLRGAAVDGRAGTYFGIVGATAGIGASTGPVLGGLLAAIDWRWIFAANVPLVAAILALGWHRIPRSVPHRTVAPDVIGAISLASLLAVPAWALTGMDGGFDPVQLALLLATAGGFVLFFRYEQRHPDPALPPSLFGIRAFSAANLTIALTNLALYGTFLAVPIALANEADATVRSGLVLTAMSAGSIVLSPVSGALVDRFGARVPTALGGMLIAVGLTMPVALGRTADMTTLLVAMPIAGAGVAMNFPATRIAALDAAPARLAGLASGVTSTSRYFGGIAGALIAGIALGRASDLTALPVVFGIFALAGLASAIVGATNLHVSGEQLFDDRKEPAVEA